MGLKPEKPKVQEWQQTDERNVVDGVVNREIAEEPTS
jgi:hypothetical protein